MLTIDQVIILAGGALSMTFVYWFFFMKKEEVVKANEKIEIIVSGGYKPSTIEIPVNKKTEISFLRKDASSCLEEVVLSEFKIKKFLPVNKKVSIEIKPEKKGVYDFSCGMNMFHGKLIVN